jgi:exodeoxyribonuclease X
MALGLDPLAFEPNSPISGPRRDGRGKQEGAIALPFTRIRVIDLETAGGGPDDVCEIGWQDVEQDPAGAWRVSEERGALFVNPGRPITANTMAIHHIQDSEVASAPFWKAVAPTILRPEGGVLALAAHRAVFEQRYCTPRFTGGADWICTWKCALRLWPQLPRFSNQLLRYLRRPEGLIHQIGLPAHRAMPDAYVTAHHLRDMLNEVPAEQLTAWSREPGLLPRVPAGPDRGKAWHDVGDEELRRLARERDPDVRFSSETELCRRGELRETSAEKPSQPRLI